MTPSLILLVLLQTAAVDRLFEKPIDDNSVLVLVRNTARTAVTFHLVVEEKTNRSRSWEIQMFPGTYNYDVVRADRGSVVLKRGNDYGLDETYVKLFFDIASKKLLKETRYTDTGLQQISDTE